MKHGHDKRIVSYEYIHNISPEDWTKFKEATNPQPNETILDGMCGYGSAGKIILEKERSINLFLLDNSKTQIERAKKNLPQIQDDHFYIDSLSKSIFEKEFFNKVIIKMGLHEMPAEEQLKTIQEVYKILKIDGQLIIGDVILNDDNQSLIQNIIRKKDELSGFDTLTEARYFFREDELLNNIKKANFSKIKELHVIDYVFSSKKILDSEFNNDEKKLDSFNKFIRERFPEKLKKSLKFQDDGNNIEFIIPKKIFVITK